MPLTENLRRSRFALLRTFRRDGTPVDTPIWFTADGDHTVVFRTKKGPKTARLDANPDIELTACDYRGRITDPATVRGKASILTGGEAQRANLALRRRYGWQWNIVPLLTIPGVTNVHRGAAAARQAPPSPGPRGLAGQRDRPNRVDTVATRGSPAPAVP